MATRNARFAALPSPVRWLVLALLPGVVLHELTHVLAAPAAADVTVEWRHLRTRFQWGETPLWRRGVVHLAPTLVGWVVLSPALLAAAWAGVRVPWWALVVVGVNAVAYVNPLGGDLDGVGYLLAAVADR